MYHLYHTDALILGSEPEGEGSRRFALLTRDCGLVSAFATSVREERSKLRYGLSDLSFSAVTLVRGKESWRVVGAVLEKNLAKDFQDIPETILLCSRIARLLRRLVTGEEKNERLFEVVREGFGSLTATPGPAIAEVEIVLVLRILYLLGYLAPRREFDSALADIGRFDPALLAEVRRFRILALSQINHSLRESHL